MSKRDFNFNKNKRKHDSRLDVIIKKDESDEAYEDAWNSVFRNKN